MTAFEKIMAGLNREGWTDMQAGTEGWGGWRRRIEGFGGHIEQAVGG